MENFKKGLFIYNKNAGDSALQQKLNQALPIISANIKELIVFQITEKNDAQKACIEYGPIVDAVYILGGDGTVHACINAIATLDKRPAIGILPGGTCNDFARTLGIPMNLKQATETLINGQITPVDLASVNDRYFLNFWGIGLVSQTAMNLDPVQKNKLGVLSYFISALKTMTQAESFLCKIESDHGVWEEEVVMVLVLNGQYLGTRPIPIPNLYYNDGMLDVLIVKNSNLGIFKDLITLNEQSWENHHSKEFSHFQTASLKVSTSHPQKVDTDGEVYLNTPAEISILPNYIRMIHE